MAKVVQIPYDFTITLPIATAQAVQKQQENPISLEALGLLVNLLSYPPTWEIHKTELYKRFAKHRETSVKNAWGNLTSANYIIEFKYRVGKKWEYVYYLRKVPFTDEEKKEILENARNEYGEIWGLDFQDLKMKSSKSRDNKKNISNKKPLSNKNNKDDEDKRTSPPEEDPLQNEEIFSIVEELKEETKKDLTARSFNAVLRKVLDKYKQGKVKSFRDYLATSLFDKIQKLELRREKERAKQEIRKGRTETLAAQEQQGKTVPFYNWLEE
jgi:hypothetical protein